MSNKQRGGEGFRSATLSAVPRSALAVAPLSISYFRDPLSNPAYDMHLHNAFHWQTKGNQQYPMCYAGGPALTGLCAA